MLGKEREITSNIQFAHFCNFDIRIITSKRGGNTQKRNIQNIPYKKIAFYNKESFRRQKCVEIKKRHFFPINE